MASRHHCLAFLLHRLGNPVASTGFNTVAPTANSIPSLCACQGLKSFRLSHTSEPEVLDVVYHSVSSVRSLSPSSTRLVVLPLPLTEPEGLREEDFKVFYPLLMTGTRRFGYVCSRRCDGGILTTFQLTSTH
jgi:hypothetical protein